MKSSGCIAISSLNAGAEPTSEQRAVIRKEMREISPSTIAAGTYPSLTKDYQTIGLYNFAVAHKDLSEDLVYKIVKTTFENHAELVKAHPTAKETILSW